MNSKLESTSPGDTKAALHPETCSVVSTFDVGFLTFQPHGYEFPISLPVITHGSRRESNAWSWNGSLDKPTLKPSILTTFPNGMKSHIWLTDGICQHLGDSTDGFAGQTLPLMPQPNTNLSDAPKNGGNAL